MASSSLNYDQLVLFDGDEDRIRIFDDIKQLSKIPKKCKFYIFCNEPHIFQEKLLSHICTISGVCVRSSSDGKNLLKILNQEVNNYSFILVVCGLNPSYGDLFSTIRKTYGYKKLFVMEMNEQSDINMKNILEQLRQHKVSSNSSTKITNDTGVFRDYPCPKCGQSFFSNNTLQEHDKNNHGSFSTKDLYTDSTTNLSSHKKTNENSKVIVESYIHCSICNDHFESQRDLINHLEKIHPDTAEDWQS